MLKKKVIIFYIAAIIFTIDRLSKYYILELSKSVENLDIPITSFLNFNLILNKNCFGLLSVNENFYYNIITLFIIAITVLILVLAMKTKY